MEGDSRALWEALGQPAWEAPLPTARSPAWRVCRQSLQAALEGTGLRQRVRSPSSLGLLLRGRLPVPGDTWGSLLEGAGWGALCAALRTGAMARGARFVTWNLRWMVSPHTARNADKRSAVRQWLEAGRIVFLQETHWSEADLAVWGACFPASTLLAAHAVLGPRGGPQGGVAILLPQGMAVLSHRVLVPGCALEVCVELDGRRARLLSLYLPPGEQRRVLPVLASSLPEDGAALFAAGDANLQFARPRAGEAEAAAEWRELFNQRAAAILDYAGPSCFGRGKVLPLIS